MKKNKPVAKTTTGKVGFEPPFDSSAAKKTDPNFKLTGVSWIYLEINFLLLC